MSLIKILIITVPKKKYTDNYNLIFNLLSIVYDTCSQSYLMKYDFVEIIIIII